MPLPERPWQKLATDLCEFNGKHYCVVSDYSSRYLEILHLTSITTEQVVKVLKATFASKSKVIMVAGDAWKDFCRQFDIEHLTSSPHNPHGNGHTEQAI